MAGKKSDVITRSVELKNVYVKALYHKCAPLLLGEMVKGDRFIFMPLPGDNNGHGGLRGEYHLFVKTDLFVDPVHPHNCMRLCDGDYQYHKDDEMVIKVRC